VGDTPASMPVSRAMICARNECQGSLTSTAEVHPWSRYTGATARRLSSVSLPVPTETILSCGTPLSANHIWPDSASV